MAKFCAVFFADGRQSVCKTCRETVATAAALVARWDVWGRERLCGEMWGAVVRTVDSVKSDCRFSKIKKKAKRVFC